jgi:hypothetical protein
MSDNRQMSVAMPRLVDFISMVTNSTLLQNNTVTLLLVTTQRKRILGVGCHNRELGTSNPKPTVTTIPTLPFSLCKLDFLRSESIGTEQLQKIIAKSTVFQSTLLSNAQGILKTQ